MTPDELKQKRRCNIKKALTVSNTTNILKGLNTFVSLKSKQAEQKRRKSRRRQNVALVRARTSKPEA